MTKIKLSLMIMALIVFISACDKDKEDNLIDLKLDKTEIADLQIGESKNIKITAGNGQYEVVSSNEDVVKVVLVKNVFTVTAVKAGESTIRLTDKKLKKTVSINVKVLANLTISTSEIIIEKGKTSEVLIISGTGDYVIESENEKIATVSIVDSKVKITAVEKGETNITLKDLKTDKTKSILVKVKVTIPLTVETENVSIKEKATIRVNVLTGMGVYTVSLADSKIATATVKDSIITVKALAKGKTILTVTDTLSKQTKDIYITVYEEKSLEIDREKIEILKGENSIVNITSGMGQYVVKTSEKSVATVALDGDKVIITAVAAGKADITVTDTKTNQSKTIEVSVIVKLALEKENVKLKIGTTENVKITAGSGKYTVRSNKEAVAKVAISRDVVKITAVAAGEAEITVTDTELNQTKTIKVYVFEEKTLAVSENEVKLLKGTSTIVKIVSGMGKYSLVSADENKATAKLDADKITITAKNSGNTIITLTDDITNQTQKITVVVFEDLVLDITSLKLKLGSTQNVNVTSGTGTYAASSDKPAVATATVSGNTIAIEAKSKGNAIITVKDTKTEQTKKITVKVTEIIALSENSINVANGGTATVAIIKGSGNYKIANNSISTCATATISGNTITITANAVGTTLIKITDTDTGEQADLYVKVGNPTFSLKRTSVSFEFSETVPERVGTINGQASYTFTYSETGIVTAEKEGDNIKLMSKKPGKTNVTITCPDGQFATLEVTVTAVNLTLYPDDTDIEVEIGSTKTIKISTGNGNYSVTANNTNVTASTKLVTPPSPASPYHVVKIQGNVVGNSIVTVKDVEEQSKIINVTVKEKTTWYKVSASGKLSIAPGQTPPSNVVFPDEATSMVDELFYGNTTIETVDFNNVKTVSYKSFYGCTKLTTVTMHDATTTIDESAFSNCDALTMVNMTKVSTIAKMAFAYSDGLTIITLPSTLTDVGYKAFYYCQNLNKVICNVSDANNITFAKKPLLGIKSTATLVVPTTATNYETKTDAEGKLIKDYFGGGLVKQ